MLHIGGKREPIIYKDRSIGILVLTVAQLFIGVIHVLFGLLLLSTETSIFHATVPYDIYTILFGFSISVFAILIWQGAKEGWFGTVAVSLFVIAADALTVLNLPSIPSIPTFAAPTEIVYSTIIVAYLLQPSVRKKFLR